MIITIVFVLYALFYIFMYNYTQNYQLRKSLASPKEPKPTAFLTDTLITFVIPWFMLILCGTFWGFTSQPEFLRRHSLSRGDDAAIWLFLALTLGLALSYTVIFQAGKFAGRREAELDLRLSGSNRRCKFQKRGQLFIRAHNETLSVVTSASATKIVRPRESTVATQPQLQPALLRLSAMISQYFTRRDPGSFALHTAMTK